MKRKIALAALLITAFSSVFTGCGKAENGSKEISKVIDYENIEKPKEIRLLSHTFSNDEEIIAGVESKFKTDTGIDLSIDNISDNNYFEVFNVAVASDRVADVVESGSVIYPSYVSYDLLYDMTDIWDICKTKNIIDNGYVDALRINGRVYGFPISNGNGTITYVRKDWLDECKLKEPTTYDEFINMLRAFKKKYPDCIPATSAGLMNSEYPYGLYLPEFYQDANPDIYMKDDGTYVDGMREENMKAALKRLKDAYNEGLIDEEVTANKTKTCREKTTGTVDKDGKVLTVGNVGVFNYWAGNWALNLNTQLQQTDKDGELIAIKPIKGSTYIERPALALVIPKYCENPESIFKYFIEYIHDGGPGETLFCIGVEGQGYEKTSKGLEPNKNAKAYFTPELSMLKDNNLGIVVNPTVLAATKLLSENSVRYPQPVMNESIGSLLPDIVVIRREIINKIVTDPEVSIEDGLKDYEKQAGAMVDTVLENLNSEKGAQ